MADRSRDAHQGIAFSFPLDTGVGWADRLLDSGSLSCSYTEAGSAPGAPVADEDNVGNLSLTAGGDMADTDTDLDLVVLRGGVPGAGAGLGWRREGETPYAGYDLPQLLTGFETIVWTDGGVGYEVRETAVSSAIGLPSGRVAVAYDDRIVLGPTTTYRVRVQRKSETTGAWSAVTVYDTTTNPGFKLRPVLWRVGSVVYCAHFVSDLVTTLATLLQVRVWRSDDECASWSLAAAEALPAEALIGISALTDAYEMSAGVYQGQTLLLITASISSTYKLAQFAAADDGLNFVRIGQADGSADTVGRYPSVLVDAEGFAVVYSSTATTDDEGVDCSESPVIRRVGSAFEPLANAPLRAVQVFNSIGTELLVNWHASGTHAELAACVDWDGAMWVYGINIDSAEYNRGLVVVSRDGGRTWARHDSITGAGGHVTGAWVATEDTDEYPVNFRPAPERGRILMAHNANASAPGVEDFWTDGSTRLSIGVLYLGGWDTWSVTAEQARRDFQASWNRTWLPYRLPAGMGWTWATAGTVSAALANGRLELSTAAGSATATIAPSTTDVRGLLVELDFELNSGGSTSSSLVGATIRIDGTNSYTLTLRCATTGYAVWDPNASGGAGANVGTATVDMTARIVVRIAVANGRVRVKHRIWSASATRQAWTDGVSGALTQAAAVGSDTFVWGVLGSDTSSSYWYRVCLRDGSSAAYDMSRADYANPRDLYPGPCGALPYPLDAGTTVAATQGQGQLDDAYALDQRADYRVENLLPELVPSPRRPWRSVSDGSDVTIPLQLHASADERTQRDLLLCALWGINFRTAYLDGWDGSTWTEIVNLDASRTRTPDGDLTRQSLRYLRHGRTLSPNPGASGGDTPMVLGLDVRGGLALLGSKARRIGRVASGRWASGAVSTSEAPCRVELLGLDGTEATSGTNAILCAPRVAAFVNLQGADYRAYRLRIPTQVTAEGYFEVGAWALRPVQLLGQRPGNGVRITMVDGTLLEEQEDGQAQVYAAAPPRREIELTWGEGVDTRGLWDTTPVVDYLYATTAASAPSNAIVEALPLDLEALAVEAEGQRQVLVYCPFVPRSSDATYVISDHERMPILCRMTGLPDREVLMGDEGDDPAMRTSVILTEVT